MKFSAFGLRPAFNVGAGETDPSMLARRRLVRQADISVFRTGDLVRDLPDDPGTNGVRTVTSLFNVVNGTPGAWGVVVAVEPQQPGAPQSSDGSFPVVPSAKARDYFVWVLEVGTRQLWVAADAGSPLDETAIGRSCGFTFASSSPVGASTLTVGNVGVGNDARIVGLASPSDFMGNTFGTAAVWVVKLDPPKTKFL